MRHQTSPAPALAGMPVPRRSLLIGAAALAAAPALAACGDDDGGGTTGGDGTGEVTFGSNEVGSTFAKQRQAAVAGFQAKNAGTTVKLNEIDHNTFQENINNYLQGSPDDVFSWFAGYRMRFFARRGLIGDISDVWPLDGVAESFKTASTGDDGKQYFVPQSYYPWAMFYRKSVWTERGYTVPTTLDELTTLADKMKSDGLAPIAFADKDGWPAMGTFDILNMRINGYQFHIDLMAGKGSWESAEVKKVFDTWGQLLPLHQPDALGRTWQEAAQALQQKKAGMYLLGTFLIDQFPQAEREDVDLFTFPAIDPAVGSDAIDAPIDGFCMSAKPKNGAGAKKLLAYLAAPEAAAEASKLGEPFISSNTKADTSSYTTIQKKSAELVGNAKNIAQFLDRDTRPDFASTVIIPAFQEFVRKPGDVASILKSIESQKKTIFID
ncbi:ABC transporter substrate-binding protein [Asanoa ishikariensis]|uniref:Carbohydrate ABC transporter substrate-binding protein, CUT1 family n=1 Tax=Asanoa ishikariensis TaxID=137265 RepID=A0A1H3QYQ9_9ACTN|nr:ABC transporter substrate-binding protein [Asanoa ishikariensis]GIF64577.1 ABC transporter substrate-binding protein [Asanoa ishikariensis]SDZ18557.1 carbohydrate ABC transporter substrate-binding protein, CUT1 family [Asanoa ishikariensis]